LSDTSPEDSVFKRHFSSLWHPEHAPDELEVRGVLLHQAVQRGRFPALALAVNSSAIGRPRRTTTKRLSKRDGTRQSARFCVTVVANKVSRHGRQMS